MSRLPGALLSLGLGGGLCGRANAKGGGKGGSAPEIVETPKAQTTKPVTEAATAARDAQREKAAKAAGLNATILTSPLGTPTENQNKKTLLGQ